MKKRSTDTGGINSIPGSGAQAQSEFDLTKRIGSR
jgi:hypothetical protein